MQKKITELKVALVHDYFREFGGAERVVEVLHDLFPHADVFTSLVNPKNLKIHWYRMRDWKFIVSWFGQLPLIRNYPSLFRFLTPYIWEGFDLSNYDLVISSSGWFMCMGVITRPETIHISYIHHQNKFLTFYETPDNWQNNLLKRIYGYIVGMPLRIWGFVASQRPDVLIANSEETKRRIEKYYRRNSDVIYPPVRDPKINIKAKIEKTEDYFITVSRLSRPKHVEVLINAANKAGFPLYVIGKGKELSYLQSIAKENVTIYGEISDIEISRLLYGAKGFLFASVDEEFGIAPVEAMMYGVPVIAYKSGGLKETVEHGKNGYLVDELTPDAFIKTISQFEKANFEAISTTAFESAKKYSEEIFKNNILQLVEKELNT